MPPIIGPQALSISTQITAQKAFVFISVSLYNAVTSQAVVRGLMTAANSSYSMTVDAGGIGRCLTVKVGIGSVW
jgi:hypothetical protein